MTQLPSPPANYNPSDMAQTRRIISQAIDQVRANLAVALATLRNSNEWPDPQFCIQDANVIVAAQNDALTGTIAPIAVSSYTTGSRTVVCNCADTTGLLVGSLIYFDAPAAAVLTAQFLRVTAITPNVSFTVVSEFANGATGPAASAACNIHVIQRGDTTGAAGGAITSQLSKSTTSTQVWLSERPAHTALLTGCKRVIIVKKSTTGPEYIYAQASAARQACVHGTMRAVGLSVYVASGVGATAQAFINGGSVIPGGTIATTPARSWISTAAVPGPNIYQYGVVLTGPVGSTFVLGEFTESVAAGPLPDGSFSTPLGQTVLALASVSPWVGIAFTAPALGGGGIIAPAPGLSGFTVDLKQVSGGVINEGVSYMMGNWEGQNQTLGEVLICYNQAAPAVFGPTLHTLITGTDGEPRKYAFACGNFLLDANARFGVGATIGQAWAHITHDLHGAVLFAAP